METKKKYHLLEEKQAFSRSILWQLQERYFSEKGVDAWRHGEVPHYVTSNPTIANSYAEIVFALYCDRARMLGAAGQSISNEPFYLCELGAGSGRFAFHFLNRLVRLCEQNGVAPASFCYVLSDVAESNLQFWNYHSKFQPFFENKMLDIARFDLNHSEELVLQRSGKIITAGSLAHPLSVIANYVFDSVPQDLYYIEQKKCYECLVTVVSDEHPQPGTAAELIRSLHYRYDYRALAGAPYGEDFLQELMQSYVETQSGTHLFFPAAALRSLNRLNHLSTAGMLLLSADKGDHELSQHPGVPVLAHHGSFSITVNYHALKLFCEQNGGLALFPDRSYSSVNTGCLLFLPEPNAYTETRRAYRRQVLDFGPDDFYKISRQVGQHMTTMSAEEVLSYLRLGHYDSQLLLLCMSHLRELMKTLNGKTQQALKNVLEEVWSIYFPLGEENDVAWHIACLYYEMGDIPKATYYFEQSLAIYGTFSGTLCNLAVCYELSGQHEKAEAYLAQVLEKDPGNEQAMQLRNKITKLQKT